MPRRIKKIPTLSKFYVIPKQRSVTSVIFSKSPHGPTATGTENPAVDMECSCSASILVSLSLSRSEAETFADKSMDSVVNLHQLTLTDHSLLVTLSNHVHAVGNIWQG